MTQINALRPITQRLMSTPAQELPQVAYFLSSSISNILKTSKRESDVQGNENAIFLHKLKTKISSLLQDRSAEGRFTAVVLIKGIIDAGGWEILSGCEVWVRGLLAILGKSDSQATKKLCLITITRIFILTQQYPTLMRQITTPLLPTFATTSLSLIKPKITRSDEGPTTVLSPLLETVLRCLIDLLPRHPSIFRPFLPRLQAISISVIADNLASDAIRDVARELLVALHFCSPKDTAGIEWAKTCNATISSIHNSADQVFRAVFETWESSDPTRQLTSVRKDFGDVVHSGEQDPLGLPGWTGLRNGAQRITSLLRLLGSFLSGKTAQQVSLPIGQVLDLTSRMTSLTTQTSVKELQFSAGPNPEVSRDEKDELWASLPEIHIATLDLLFVLILRFSSSLLPVVKTILYQTLWVFNDEKWHETIRTASYRVVGGLMPFLALSMSKGDIQTVSSMIMSCCADQLSMIQQVGPATSSSSSTSKIQRNASTSNNADSFLNAKGTLGQEAQSTSMTAISHAASKFLAVFLIDVPAQVIPHYLRSEIDRTAILTQSKEAMFASVLNPPPALKGRPAPPSILPFLARSSGHDTNLESLLRPRMPVLRNIKFSTNLAAEDLDQEEIDDMNVDSSKGTDLLDQLEHSLDNSPVEITNQNISQTSTSEPGNGMITVGASGPGRMKTAQEIPPIGPAKRNFTDLTADETSANTDSEQELKISTSGLSKRVRHNTSLESDDLTAIEKIGSRALTDFRATAVPAEHSVGATESLPQVDDPIRTELEVDDSGNSEFEMPEINLEPDTEDDDDDDDEEQEKNGGDKE